MRIDLIQPLIPAQAVFTQKIPEVGRFSTQLGLLVVAALTPAEFEVRVINEQIEHVDFSAPVDLVGISTLTANIKRAYTLSRRFREQGVIVVLGGIHASLCLDEALGHCDAVVVGEAEYTWPRLLADWQRGQLQPVYKAERLTDMADVPIPRRDLDLTVGYVDKIEASRGCPFDCDFCSTNLHFGGKHRTRPIPKIIADIETVHHNRYHLFTFTDDNIVGNKSFARKLFKALIPLKIHWASQCAIQIADDAELLDLARKSGCRALSIGFESLSARNLLLEGKKANNVMAYATQIAKIKDAGIQILANFVFGFDDDDPSVFAKTVDFVRQNGIEHVYFTVLTPYPQTRLRQRLASENRILHSDWHQYDTLHSVIEPKSMTPDQLEQGLRWAYEAIYPGCQFEIFDPKAHYQGSLLHEASRLLIEVSRKKDRP